MEKAKRDHWCNFLSKATPRTVWTAKKVAIGRPPRSQELPRASTPLVLNTALLDYFFPRNLVVTPDTILLPFKDILVVEASEINMQLARSSPLSAPGPDKTPNCVWKRINKVAPGLILNLWTLLVSYGYQPPLLKRVDGIVQDKSGKPSSDSPSFFRVIVRLQTFSKIVERIINGCLSCVAHMTGIITRHQCGSQAGLSVSDACNTMTLEITTLQMDKRKVSTLFIDIKGGFDNVNPSSLCGMLKAKSVNPYLVSWTRS